mmetsp:Transcript_44015/g.111339  ORF Transcript_44015/g.111339 Transcript_44015/m.111339 type:complete len:237 (+) Transcript_44015:1036-1746(+)
MHSASCSRCWPWPTMPCMSLSRDSHSRKVMRTRKLTIISSMELLTLNSSSGTLDGVRWAGVVAGVAAGLAPGTLSALPRSSDGCAARSPVARALSIRCSLAGGSSDCFSFSAAGSAGGWASAGAASGFSGAVPVAAASSAGLAAFPSPGSALGASSLAGSASAEAVGGVGSRALFRDIRSTEETPALELAMRCFSQRMISATRSMDRRRLSTTVFCGSPMRDRLFTIWGTNWARLA